MEAHAIHEAAMQQGIVPQALDQVTAKVQAHFAGRTPRPIDLDAYLATLPTWEKLGMTQDAFDAAPVSWRLMQGEVLKPPPLQRRPVMRALTDEELQRLEGLPFHERHERGRAMQQTKAPKEEAG